MKIKLPEWVKAKAGRDGDLVYYGNKNIEGVCYARQYVYPTLTEHHRDFGSKVGSVANTWNEADAGFKADMKIFADAWNETHRSVTEPKQNLTGMNLFIKGCFAVAKAASFDLNKLSVDNFGGKAGDLLGTATPNAGNFIKAAGLTDCGIDLNMLVAVALKK